MENVTVTHSGQHSNEPCDEQSAGGWMPCLLLCTSSILLCLIHIATLGNSGFIVAFKSCLLDTAAMFFESAHPVWTQLHTYHGCFTSDVLHLYCRCVTGTMFYTHSTDVLHTYHKHPYTYCSWFKTDHSVHTADVLYTYHILHTYHICFTDSTQGLHTYHISFTDSTQGLHTYPRRPFLLCHVFFCSVCFSSNSLSLLVLQLWAAYCSPPR